MRWAVALLVAATQAVGAQQVRGVIVDSMSRRTIPGAVVTVLDASGTVLARNISNDQGVYSLPLPMGAARIRIVRIGFRPRELPIPNAPDGYARADVGMLAIPTMLEAARVDARQCPKRSDSERAYGLWEQVRAGLLATIVAREQNPAALALINYTRVFQGTSNRIIQQQIKLDSTQQAMNSYRASRSAADFVKFGFNTMQNDGLVFFGPDAEVLLDNGFTDGYCFRLVRGDRSRPNQVGLGFSTPDRRTGRVDIDGALWVDTIARVLKDIDFKYLGIDRPVDALEPGGNVSFRELPNGVAIIDRWHLRMIGATGDTVPGPLRNGVRSVTVRPRYYATSSGGEVADGRWPDRTRYHSRLGTLLLDVQTLAGAPAVGRKVRLADTPYEQVLDSSGVFEVRDMLPGPYWLVTPEPLLKPLLMDSIPSHFEFVAARDSVHVATVKLPTLEEWINELCGTRRASGTEGTFVLIRVLDVGGRPIAGFNVNVEHRAASEVATDWRPVGRAMMTGTDGLVPVCSTELPVGHQLAVHLWSSGMAPRIVHGQVTGRVTILPAVFTR